MISSEGDQWGRYNLPRNIFQAIFKAIHTTSVHQRITPQIVRIVTLVIGSSRFVACPLTGWTSYGYVHQLNPIEVHETSWNPIQSPFNHHSITIQSPWNISVKSPLNPIKSTIQSTIQSPWKTPFFLVKSHRFPPHPPLPVPLSAALTFTMPLASMSKVTSILDRSATAHQCWLKIMMIIGKIFIIMMIIMIYIYNIPNIY